MALSPAEVMLSQLEARERQSNPAAALLAQLEAQEAQQQPPEPMPSRSFSGMAAPTAGPPFSQVAQIPALLGMVGTPKNEMSAADAGVDIYNGISMGRGRASLAPNLAYQQAYMSQMAGKVLGKDVDVRIGPQSNAMEYMNPKTGKWSLVDESNFSSADLKDIFGPSLTALGAGAGAVAGAPFGGVIGASGGAGVGVFISEMGRLHLGKKVGVHKLSEKEMIYEAAKKAGLETVFTLASEKVLHLGQMAMRFWKPHALDRNITERTLEDMRSLSGDMSELRREIGPGFNPNIPEMLRDPELHAEYTRAVSGSSKMREQEQLRQIGNKAAVSDYYERTFKPASDPSQGDRVGASLQAQDSAANTLAAQKIDASQAQLESATRQSIRDLPVYDETAFGKHARTIVQDEAVRLKKETSDAYKAYEAHIGFNKEKMTSNYPAVIPNKHAEDVFSSMSAEARKAIFSFEASHVQQSLPRDLRSLSLTGVDLAVLNNSIRRIRGRINRGDYGIDISQSDLVRAESAMKSMRAEYLAKHDPAALKLLEQAEAAAKVEASVVKQGALAEILRRSPQGDYKLSDSDVFSRIFLKNDVEAAAELYRIADPEQRVALQRGIWALYRANFTNNGVPSVALHGKFMDHHGDVAKAYFPKEDWGKLTEFGGMAEVIERESKRSVAARKALEKGLSRKFSSAPSEDIIPDIVSGKFSNLEMRQIRQYLRSGRYYKEAVESVGLEIQRRYFKDGALDHTRLLDYLNSDKTTSLANLVGDKYIRNLRTLAAAARIASSPGKVPLRSEKGILEIAARPLLRPLSREGLVRSAVAQINVKQRDRVMRDILSDPQKLDEYARLIRGRASARRVTAFLAAVGGASLIEETDQ